MSQEFLNSLSKLAVDIHLNAINKGFWDSEENRYTGNKLALIHSEISEALEAYRTRKEIDDHCPEFKGIEIELADAVIRIIDFCTYNELHLGEAILAKNEYNKTRPYMHNKVI